MDRRTLPRIALALVLLGLWVTGCGAGESPAAATQAPTSPPPQVARGRCGDGLCDAAEQADPSLCPQDCEPTAAPAAPTEAPSPVPPTATQVLAAEPTEEEMATPGSKCGDGICDEVEQEDPSLCPQDCVTPTPELAVTVAVTAEEAPPPPTIAPAEPTALVGAREAAVSPIGEIAYVGDPATVSQDVEAGEAPQSNLALILDGSGSMGEELPGTGKTKLAVAKEVMAELIPQIPEEMNGTLWIYAHRYPAQPKAKSCTDIEQVFPLGPVDAAAYVAKIQEIKANGWTPIADSIVTAAQVLPPGDFNNIVLVSDGEETCGGDPCAVAEALKASDAELTVHVVGYDVDDATRKQLQCVARVSGGSYHDATDAEGLLQALEEALAATVVETVLRVEILDPNGAEVGGTIRLYEAGTDRLVSEYSAWKDNVVAPGTYDLLVDTPPDLFYAGLTLPEHSTTVVRIVLSGIRVLTPDGKEDTFVELYDIAGTKLDAVYAGMILVVPGSYQVRVRGSISQPLTLGAGELVELRLGIIHVLTPDGREDTMVDVLDTAGQRLDFGYAGTLLLVPGTYHLGVNDTRSQAIVLDADQTVEFRLGLIQVGGSFELYDGSGNRLGLSRRESSLVVPGTYTVKFPDGRTVDNVVVEAGQVTQCNR